MDATSHLQRLGAGLAFRSALADAIFEYQGQIDWLEITTDHYLDDPWAEEALGELTALFPVAVHGLELSIGSDGPLDLSYLDGVARVADLVDAAWVSDHLCFTTEDGYQLGNLTPVHRTRERAAAIAAKVRHVQDRLGRPFLLENITYQVDLPSELSESEFITEVMEHCDASILLDLENVSINAANHRFDPYMFLERIPLERVVEVHLAGDRSCSAPRVDAHNAPVSEECLDLLAFVVARADIHGVIVERDEDFPADFTELLADVDSARRVLVQGGRR